MILTRVDIEQFRGIRHIGLDLDPVTAVIGENNSGKTSVLDALAIVLGRAGNGLTFEPRDFHRPDDGPPASRLRIVLTFAEPEAREPNVAAAAPGGPARRSRRGRHPRARREFVVEASRTSDPELVTVTAGFVRRPGIAPSGVDGRALADLRRLSPVIRLRANRYIESDPRRGLAGSEPQPPSGSDPVAWQLEQQFANAFRALTGDAELSAAELNDGLAAARTLLTRVDRRLLDRLATPGHTDPFETPVRIGGRPGLGLAAIKEGAGVRGLALLAVLGAWLRAREGQPIAFDARPIVVVEDAEAHLHPMALSAMWSLIDGIPAQKIVTTNSGELLASIPLGSIRRLVRDAEGVRVHQIDAEALSPDDRRRVAYHVRINRAGAMFARCWILVEGETEAWLVPEIARACGYDLPAEGVRCVEFAQCGLRPLIRLARSLGIGWHVLTDGDDAGKGYAATARAFLDGAPESAHLTALGARDLEHYLWQHGYAPVFLAAAGAWPAVARRTKPSHVIERAIKARSKPGLALAVVDAMEQPHSPGVPPLLRTIVESVVGFARSLGT
jgi:putative ATP-dependent endonuclease of OLD family